MVLEVLFEVRVNYPTTSRKRSKSQRDNRDSLSLEVSPSKVRPRKRTNRLLHDLEVEDKAIKRKHNFESQILKMWQCRDENCLNEKSFCWIDPETKNHFALSAALQKSWANAYNAGKATVSQPPWRIQKYLRIKCGPVGEGVKRPVQISKVQETRSALQRLEELQTKQMEMAMARSIQSSLERDKDRQEAREARRRQEQIQPPWPSAPPPWLFGGEAAGNRSQPIYAPPPYPFTSPSPFAQAISAPPPLPPLSAPASIISSRPISRQAGSSSPLADDFLTYFFEWRIKSMDSEARRNKMAAVRDIVEEEDWSIEDLRSMADPNSRLYKMAIKKQIPDGTTRGFKKWLSAFKPLAEQARSEHLAAASLSNLRSS